MTTAAVLVVEILVLCILVFLIIREYISFKRTVWYAIASAWIGWILCFAIVLMLPLDIANTDHTQCMKNNNNDESLCHEPISYVSYDAMVVQWSIIYWGTFILSWLIFPILQNYWLAGDFTRGERLLRSVKENMILYSIMGVAGIAFILGLLIVNQLKGAQLQSLIMALANAYGLVLVVVLMGYGLVDIPRYLFRKGSRDRMMRYFQLEAVVLREGLNKAQDELTTVLKQVKLLSTKVAQYDPYRSYVDKIINKCPPELDEITEGEGENELSYEKLSDLHAKVKDMRHSAQRAAILYEMLLKKAHEEEDIIASYNSPTHTINWSFRPPRTHKYAGFVNKLEWVWLVYLYPWVFRLLGLSAAVLSVMIVWCEITLPAPQDLSPLSAIIRQTNMTGFGKQVFVFIPLAYMTMCSYTTLFKIRIFNYYRLVPHHMSDANSIMFSANYLCRLAAPLAYNFLSIISQGDAQTAFHKVMGEMDAFSFSSYFRNIFPILVVVVCLMAIFNVFVRIAACCCIKSLRYTVDESPSAIEQGVTILRESRQEKNGGAKRTNKSIKESIYSKFSKVNGKSSLRSVRTENPGESDGATVHKSINSGTPKPSARNTAVITASSNSSSSTVSLIANKYGRRSLNTGESSSSAKTPIKPSESNNNNNNSRSSKSSVFGFWGKKTDDGGEIELLERDNV